MCILEKAKEKEESTGKKELLMSFPKNISLHLYSSPFHFNPSADDDSLHCLGQMKYLLYHWGVVE